MTYFKKTAVAAVLAIGSSAVFAGTMGPVCTAVPVTVPCETVAWDFGGKALYLQALYSGDFGYNAVTFNSNETHFHRANNKWGWGFMIEGSYHFGTGNDLNVNWYHFSKNHNRDNTSFAIENELTRAGLLAINDKPRWDAVNIEFGQHVDFGDFKNIRFHAGGQFAQVKHHTNLFLNAANFGSFHEKFEGFGVRTGADMAYEFGNGVAFYGNAAAAVLVGTSKFANRVVIRDVATTLVTGSRNALVPELEGKLGGTYTYGMAQGNLILDVGYIWVNYFNALNNFNLHSDFGVDGVQFGLKYIGAV